MPIPRWWSRSVKLTQLSQPSLEQVRADDKATLFAKTERAMRTGGACERCSALGAMRRFASVRVYRFASVKCSPHTWTHEALKWVPIDGLDLRNCENLRDASLGLKEGSRNGAPYLKLTAYEGFLPNRLPGARPARLGPSRGPKMQKRFLRPRIRRPFWVGFGALALAHSSASLRRLLFPSILRSHSSLPALSCRP
jgi:hypothetical protein